MGTVSGKCIVEDTLQKKGMHEAKNGYWRQVGCNVIRCRLPVGDYVSMPAISVDTKQDIYELASDIDNDHERFRDEQIRARDNGCQLVVLVENLDGVTDLSTLSKWRESDRHFAMRDGKRRIFGSRLARACKTMGDRYGTLFRFCTPNEAGRRVLEILGGEFDG